MRDVTVTGVQTCALPVSRNVRSTFRGSERRRAHDNATVSASASTRPMRDRKSVVYGKSVDLGGRRIIKKKKRAYEPFAHTLGVDDLALRLSPDLLFVHQV